jgi:hypothetical protein
VSNAAPGLGRAADGEGQGEGAGITPFIVGGLAVAAIVAGAVTAAESEGSGDDNATPG